MQKEPSLRSCQELVVFASYQSIIIHYCTGAQWHASRASRSQRGPLTARGSRVALRHLVFSVAQALLHTVYYSRSLVAGCKPYATTADGRRLLTLVGGLVVHSSRVSNNQAEASAT